MTSLIASNGLYFAEKDFHTHENKRNVKLLAFCSEERMKSPEGESWVAWEMDLGHRLPRCLPIAAQRVVYIVFSPM